MKNIDQIKAEAAIQALLNQLTQANLAIANLSALLAEQAEKLNKAEVK